MILLYWPTVLVLFLKFQLYLGKAFLAIIFKVFGVDVNVVLVNSVRLSEFG